MTTSEIKKICLEGSKKYYQFLESKKNGGVEEIGIRNIVQVDRVTFKLIIDKKLFDTETVFFQYSGETYKNFSGDAIRVKLYDNDKRILMVQAKGDALDYLSKKVAKDWKVVIDLKFLVQRVIDWYEENGARLVFDFGKMSKATFDESVILPGITPSDEQRGALHTIFSNKVSYIWGAPGTGKTKFVLSYALLHYLKQKKKVFVLAPTNVALEQIFDGVIGVTDEAGIKRGNILRLGYPSKEFADKYGEVCEVLGLEKELKKLNEQIKILSAVLGLKSEGEKQIERLILSLESMQNLLGHVSKLDGQKKDLDQQRKEINAGIVKCQVRRNVLDKQEKEWIRKKTSLTGRLLRSFSNKVDFDVELEQVELKRIATENEKKRYLDRLSSLRSNIKELEASREEKQKEVTRIQQMLVEQGVKVSNFRDINEQMEQLEIQQKTEKSEKSVYKSLAKEYERYSPTQLEEMLSRAKTEKKRLETYSLDMRLKSSLLIGATLDTYLHRFKDQDSGAHHIFIDEAGYASVVKALTVFTKKIPITFLGDHQQLPPVCEISKVKIQKQEDLQDVFVWDQSAIFIGELVRSKDRKEALAKYLNLAQPSQESLPRTSLTSSYRFGPNLAQTLEKYVYSDGFSSTKDENTEIVTVSVNNPAQWRNKKRLNEAEALAIKEYVTQNFTVDSSVAILAPYRDQVNRIKNLLPDFKDENKILTVHKSQGREWDTVIYSVCDIGNGKKPWFTDTTSTISNGLNNVNTAVSRARKRLVIFCSKEEWAHREDQLIAGLLRASTKESRYKIEDVPELQPTTFPPAPKQPKPKTLPKPPPKTPTTDLPFDHNKLGPERGKNYRPSGRDEVWQSKMLIWSVKKLPGFSYSQNKKAYWIKKEKLGIE